MVSIWKAPVLAYRGVFKLWLKNLCIWHIIYLTGQPEDRLSLSVPANYNAMWAAYSLPESRAAYLFFKFRIATIKRPIVSITINSSYVLMSTTPFRRTRNEMAARPPDCPGKHIILSWCSNSPIWNRRNRSHLKCGCLEMYLMHIKKSIKLTSHIWNEQRGIWLDPTRLLPGRYPLICSMPFDASGRPYTGSIAIDGWFYQWMHKTSVWGE